MTNQDPQRKTVQQKVGKHRETLKALAESDLPCSWLAEALLEIEDESE